MRRAIVLLLDFVDDWVLNHRWYRFCHWLATHPWWEKPGTAEFKRWEELHRDRNGGAR